MIHFYKSPALHQTQEDINGRQVSQEAVLRNGKHVLVRPFRRRDTKKLFAFFQRLPADVRRFAWDNIDDPNLVESWGQNIDYSKAMPLLALNGREIVADATLHRTERGPLRLVGRVKWLIDPEYRGQGLGTALVNSLISVARDHGLRHLTCMLIATELEAEAIATLETFGFEKYKIPDYGTDPDGNQYDMVKLVLKL